MEETTATAPALSDTEVIRAATNDPALSERQIKLGDRTFTIVDLEYDDYLVFITKLAPLMKAFASGLLASKGIGSESPSLDPLAIIEYCASDVPELALLVCSQTDKTITLKEVKKLGKNPFNLATVVLKQIEQNNMIGDITSFFAQILPLLRVTAGSQKSQ